MASWTVKSWRNCLPAAKGDDSRGIAERAVADFGTFCGMRRQWLPELLRYLPKSAVLDDSYLQKSAVYGYSYLLKSAEFDRCYFRIRAFALVKPLPRFHCLALSRLLLRRLIPAGWAAGRARLPARSRLRRRQSRCGTRGPFWRARLAWGRLRLARRSRQWCAGRTPWRIPHR